MRHVNHGLDRFFVKGQADFIEQQGQNNRRRKKEHQIVERQHQRIAQQHKEIGILKENPEMLKAYPIAFPKSQERLIILKRQQDPPHGNIFENKKIQQAGSQQNV
ncbi:hypothetical protein D3C75_760250 [compost metagenome]